VFLLKKHFGPILEPSQDGFDRGGTGWGCVFADPHDSRTTYLYYSGSTDTTWTRAAIGLAVSNDGISFRKLKEMNPVVDGEGVAFNSGVSITPAVVRISNRYYMFFAGGRRSTLFPRLSRRTRIGVAYADDPCGPWTVTGVIASPEFGWEGLSIDLGPSVVSLGEGEILAYYSNSLNSLPLSLLGTKYMKYLLRRIGILKIKIRSPSSIIVHRYGGNPLQLNGPRGSPSESVFCPGHFVLRNTHFLVPTMGTYSVGFPFHQYIGLASGSSPYFAEASATSVLIDGPAEKNGVLNSRGEVAFDTPCPVVRKDKIRVYYSAMDRHDAIWKTALSDFELR
jgi:hypothetical protein